MFFTFIQRNFVIYYKILYLFTNISLHLPKDQKQLYLKLGNQV